MRMKNGMKILISVGVGVLCAPLSAFAPLLALPLFAFAGFMGSQWSVPYMLPALLGGGLGAYFTGFAANPTAGVIMLASVCLVTFLLGGKSVPHRIYAVALLIVISAGLYLSMTLGSMLSGEAPTAGAVEAWETLFVEPFAKAAAAYPDSAEAVDSMREFGLMIPDLLLWSCVLTGEAAAFGLVMLNRGVRRAFKAETRPMAPFIEWTLPSSAFIGLLISAAACAVPFIIKHDGAKSFAFSVGLIWASMFAVQGLASLLFVFRHTKAPKVLPILSCVICAVTVPFSVGVLAMMGIREQITKRRTAFKRYMKQMEAKNKAMDRAEELAKFGYIRPERRDEDSPDNKDETDKED